MENIDDRINSLVARGTARRKFFEPALSFLTAKHSVSEIFIFSTIFFVNFLANLKYYLIGNGASFWLVFCLALSIFSLALAVFIFLRNGKSDKNIEYGSLKMIQISGMFLILAINFFYFRESAKEVLNNGGYLNVFNIACLVYALLYSIKAVFWFCTFNTKKIGAALLSLPAADFSLKNMWPPLLGCIAGIAVYLNDAWPFIVKTSSAGLNHGLMFEGAFLKDEGILIISLGQGVAVGLLIVWLFEKIISFRSTAISR
jgi:hypothetical protein